MKLESAHGKRRVTKKDSYISRFVAHHIIERCFQALLFRCGIMSLGSMVEDFEVHAKRSRGLWPIVKQSSKNV